MRCFDGASKNGPSVLTDARSICLEHFEPTSPAHGAMVRFADHSLSSAPRFHDLRKRWRLLSSRVSLNHPSGHPWHGRTDHPWLMLGSQSERQKCCARLFLSCPQPHGFVARWSHGLPSVVTWIDCRQGTLRHPLRRSYGVTSQEWKGVPSPRLSAGRSLQPRYGEATRRGNWTGPPHPRAALCLGPRPSDLPKIPK